MEIDARLAERTAKIHPSSTLAITSKAKKLKAEGKNVISLAAGEPDFDTPDFIKEAAVSAINAGFTKYTPTTGIAELKVLICEKFKKDNGLTYSPSQIVVSSGAKHSIFNALFVLIGKGDEVVIPSPYWVSYPEMVNLCDGSPVIIKTSPGNNFKLTPEELKRHISPRTKVLILNSPSNPCGTVYNLKELEGIAAVCREKKIYIISDEIYEKLIYDNNKHVSIAGFDSQVKELTVTVNGLSKSFSMTGWRIGYLAAPQYIADAISNLQDHTTSNPVSISQKAAVAALSASDDFSRKMSAEFQKRRDFALSRLDEIGKFKYVRPQGAFYIFCDISATGMGSLQLANRMLEEINVAAIPGDGFGWDNYLRLSFATGIQQMAEAFDRIKAWLK
jgi:aspartate aminotransferase